MHANKKLQGMDRPDTAAIFLPAKSARNAALYISTPLCLNWKCREKNQPLRAGGLTRLQLNR